MTRLPAFRAAVRQRHGRCPRMPPPPLGKASNSAQSAHSRVSIMILPRLRYAMILCVVAVVSVFLAHADPPPVAAQTTPGVRVSTEKLVLHVGSTACYTTTTTTVPDLDQGALHLTVSFAGNLVKAETSNPGQYLDSGVAPVDDLCYGSGGYCRDRDIPRDSPATAGSAPNADWPLQRCLGCVCRCDGARGASQTDGEVQAHRAIG